jgi:dephospho-CoA kinase
MLKVGLTGNLGSGKSLVAKIFEISGVPVYHADDISKKFLTNNTVRQKIRNAFGSEAFIKGDDIDRKKLGKIVFSDPGKLTILNSILHPLVKDDFRLWIASHTEHPYVIQEAAIIFESGYHCEFDKIIHVSCPENICIERAIIRDQASREELLQRIRFQWEDEKKAAMSDFIILNDGSEMVIPQVLKIRDLLMNLSLQDKEV